MGYYDAIAPGYDELHREEQLKKLFLILDRLKVSAADSVLDVGCGTAFSFEALEAVGCRFQGVEPSRGLIAQSRYQEKIVCCGAEDIPFPPDLFSVVVSITALHNFSDPRAGLLEMRRVCSDRLGVSFLKKSSRREELDALLRELFVVDEVFEEAHDVVYLLLADQKV